MKKFLLFILVSVFGISFSQITKNYSVNGTERKVIMYEPTVKSEKIPVIFVFHGHGGTAKFASWRMDFQNYYKEALVIFMQGMPGRKVPKIDPNGTKNGWQISTDDLEGRDIQFFDYVLADIHKNYKIDDNKIFVVGHSNGARFVNVLWATRADQLAGIISVSAQGGLMISGAKPVSFWMSMGKNDPIVPYENQKLSIPIVQKNLGVDVKKFSENGDTKIYKGIKNTELVLVERKAGHEFPQQSIPEMVTFLKRQIRN